MKGGKHTVIYDMTGSTGCDTPLC